MLKPRRALQALALLALSLALACATPGLPDGPKAGTVTHSAIKRAEKSYLYPERLDRRVMVGALDALENRFDSVRFDADSGEDYGTLSVGDESVRVPLDSEFDAEHFEVVLGSALHFVESRLGVEANRDTDTSLELIALRGALNALDRYTTVFSGRGTQDFQIRFSGKLHGIGARIGRRDGHLVAVRVFPKSPAERADLREGDAILYIDGDPTRPLSVGEAVGQIRGKAGSTVVLTVLREEKELELAVIRGEVTVPSVEARELAPGVGYARITTVSRTTADEFRAKVLELGPLTGLVLDLRGNTGGSMTAAAALADFFLEEGLIVRIVRREGDSGRGRAARPGVLLGAKVVILVGQATASAAEILSGAIAPLSRVTIVGQTTYGKGLIQQVVPLPDRNLLKLTVGEYLLSSDRVIHEKGIEPDIVLFPVSSDNLGRLALVPEGALSYLRKPGEDDLLPIEFATALLEQGKADALQQATARADEEIQQALLPYGITWRAEQEWSAEPLPEPLEITATSPTLVGGKITPVQVRVTNPNDFAIEHAWAALQGPAPYLANKLVALGNVPAGGSSEGSVELTPSDGLSVDPLVLDVLVASASTPIQSERVVLDVERRPTQLEIVVTRIEDEMVRVTLLNRGCCDPGPVRVAVPGAVRALETLPSNEPQSVELPLTGKVKRIVVLLSGAGVTRRIEIPLPDDEITVVPPAVELERDSWLGRPLLRVRAQASEGLRQGWLALDGQKEIYVAWNGSQDGVMRADLLGGDQSVTTKIETVSGVAVIDNRTLRAD